MKDIELKIIRGVDLKYSSSDKSDENIVYVKYIEDFEQSAKRHVFDSELLRIIAALDKDENVEKDMDGRTYLSSVISVDIGNYTKIYEKILNNDGVLVLQHYKYREKEEEEEEEGSSSKLEPLDQKERFKRLMVGSGHSRNKKALFVREELFDVVNKVLLGGVDKVEENGYPIYRKGCAKWNSYYALASTDSKPVKEIPNIVVVADYTRNVEDTFDVVKRKKETNPKWREGDDINYKYLDKYKYDVESNEELEVEIMPFDGAGLVSVECAKKWAEELGIQNSKCKGYIPASFQFRAIPGIKGNVYTFDIKKFGEENGYIITDIKGKQHDIRDRDVDVILTESQVKFFKLYNEEIDLWKEKFEEPVMSADGEREYKRTFNISEYSEDSCDLDHKMRSSYQHLQTINFEDSEIETFVASTLEEIEKVSTSVDEFLRYRGCTEKKKRENTKDWNRIPSYYIAAYHMDKKKREVLINDEYFKGKMNEDIDGFVKRTLTGKIFMHGNYQTLTPDLYGLAQYAFGEREDSKIGLLKEEEVFSKWWLKENKWDSPDSTDKKELALIRNPHIYMEARIVKAVSKQGVNDQAELERIEKIYKWFKFQTTGIVTDSFSTIPLALGTADFDGDHIVSTDSVEYITAVKHARKEKHGNTVYYMEQTKPAIGEDMPNVSDIKKLMHSDVLAFSNNIGTVIDKVTELWGVERNDENDRIVIDYIIITDIIGQLTIDAAKTGEFVGFYDAITDYLKAHNVKEPYFKRYLKKKKGKLTKEKNAINNIRLYFQNDQDMIEANKKFSDENTNMNRICHYIEKQLEEADNDTNSIKTTTTADKPADKLKFIKLFLGELPQTRSDLFKRVRSAMTNLSNEHKKIHKIHSTHESEDYHQKKAKGLHYDYFYSYARYELLSQCKLSEEKSINKIINIILWLAYVDKDFFNDDNVKNIMWNSFSAEMISRAKGNVTDKDIDWSEIENRLGKHKNMKDKVNPKKKELKIKDLSKEEADNPIVVTEKDIAYIQESIKPSGLLRGKKIGKSKAKLLRHLFAVLMVISKRLEKDVVRRCCDKEGNESKVSYPRVRDVVINKAANDQLNYSSLARLAGFDDYKRKRMPNMLKDLQDLGLLEINFKDMAKLKFKVIYEPNNDKNAIDKVIEDPDSYNYEDICATLTKRIR